MLVLRSEVKEAVMLATVGGGERERGGVMGGGFTLELIKEEDPPNAHQAKRGPNPRFDESGQDKVT